MAIQIQFRRGTASEWTAENPILAVGEMGIETDTDQFKVGDGTTAWNSLTYGGIQGPTGPTGPSGANGTNGINGATGPTGPTGPAGATTGLVSQTNGTVTTAATNQNVVRNITLSVTGPVSGSGSDGDVWLVYTA